jgi:hypothetical protein
MINLCVECRLCSPTLLLPHTIKKGERAGVSVSGRADREERKGQVGQLGSPCECWDRKKKNAERGEHNWRELEVSSSSHLIFSSRKTLFVFLTLVCYTKNWSVFQFIFFRILVILGERH